MTQRMINQVRRGAAASIAVFCATVLTAPAPTGAAPVPDPDPSTVRSSPMAKAYQWPVGEVAGGGGVRWYARDHRGASYRHSTGWWGAASTKIVIRGPRAPHIYRFHLQLPRRVKLSKNAFGEVVAKRRGAAVGLLAAPWARDDAGHKKASWFTVHRDGRVVKQHVRFGHHAAFPIRADPWWNPMDWEWSEVFSVTWHGVRSCGDGAVHYVGELAGGVATTNLLLTHVSGRAALMVPGGAYAYAGWAAIGCLGSFF